MIHLRSMWVENKEWVWFNSKSSISVCHLLGLRGGPLIMAFLPYQLLIVRSIKNLTSHLPSKMSISCSQFSNKNLIVQRGKGSILSHKLLHIIQLLNRKEAQMTFFNRNLWFSKIHLFLISINPVWLTNHLKTSRSNHLFKELLALLVLLIPLLQVDRKAKKLEIQDYQLTDLQGWKLKN